MALKEDLEVMCKLFKFKKFVLSLDVYEQQMLFGCLIRSVTNLHIGNVTTKSINCYIKGSSETLWTSEDFWRDLYQYYNENNKLIEFVDIVLRV